MMPFQTILFAADFSDRSREAFRVACSLATENGSRLVLLHVVERIPAMEQPTQFGESGVEVPLPSEIQAEHDALKERLREFYPPSRPIDLLYFTREGAAAEGILHTANELGADLIVMGTHGRTGLRRLLAGSVAETVLRHAHCPVLALRSPDLPHEAIELQAILHPTDFSERSEAALQVARSLARDHGAKLIILHVAPLTVLMEGPAVVPMDPRFYRDCLEEIRKRVDGPDLKYPVEIRFNEGDAASEIVAEAKECRCGLIVLGTHGRTGLVRLLMGSIAEAVMRKAVCPVLVVNSREVQAAVTPDSLSSTVLSLD